MNRKNWIELRACESNVHYNGTILKWIKIEPVWLNQACRSKQTSLKYIQINHNQNTLIETNQNKHYNWNIPKWIRIELNQELESQSEHYNGMIPNESVLNQYDWIELAGQNKHY